MAIDTEQVRYERIGAAAVLTIDREERRNAVDGPTAELLKEGYEQFIADDDARVLILTGAGDVSFCAGADLKAIETFAPRLADPDGPLGFTRRTPPKPTIAAISGWCLAGGMELALWCDLRIATAGLDARLPRTPLGRAADRRRHAAAAADRRPGARARHHPHRPDDRSGRSPPDGPAQRDSPRRTHLDRSLAIAEALASFPQITMLADRSAAIEGLGMPLEEGLVREAEAAMETFETAVEGAGRFASGEGRGGGGAGV